MNWKIEAAEGGGSFQVWELWRYRIQRQGLPKGDAADCHFSRTSDLLSQFVEPLLNSTTSHLWSTFVNDLHLCAHLFDSPQLSFQLSFQLSSQLLSTCVDSPQFHLSNLFSARSKWHKRKLSFAAQFNCLSSRTIRLTRSSCALALFETLPWRQLSVFDGLFSLCSARIVWTFHCVVIFVWCTIIQSYCTVTCRAHVQARWSRSIFRRAQAAQPCAARSPCEISKLLVLHVISTHKRKNDDLICSAF